MSGLPFINWNAYVILRMPIFPISGRGGLQNCRHHRNFCPEDAGKSALWFWRAFNVRSGRQGEISYCAT